jgi:hypothetical protein
MVDPVNLNIPGLDYFSFAVLFFAVVGLFTLVFARLELALRRERWARATQDSALLVSQRVEGSLEWVSVQGQNAMDRAREERTRRQSRGSPDDLIDEAEE